MRATPPEVRVLDGAAYYRDDGRDGDRPEARRGAYGRPIHFRFVPLDRHPMRNDSSHVDQPDDERAEVRRDAYGRPIYFRFIPLDKHPMRNDSYGNQYDDHRGQNER